ncbi:hypothetical protein J7I97_17555 [Streptomyces sp. ISL-87]|uniref:hypothetical protein n=1 Tax=Streptomyces sp. ISL-87 TaxID=2819188 RepID=UPI001BECDD09|nr:hypothetical protein [Streptomyces sp. ISL-87]MBT2610026.1 hypothetical protein [Streptomyces sp. ISL-87]
MQDDDPEELTLIVDTPNGTHIRCVPPALPLPAHIDHGPGAEEATHMAAAAWGMPDFVFQQAAHAAKGSGRRELGDRLLLAGHRGAVVQVKARTISPKTDAQEISWIQKVAAKAMSQAKGTVRQLRMLPADMVNGRNRTLHVDGHAFEWIAVFLLDHPRVPRDAVPTWQPLGIPAIALTRRDWDFLFNQLRSTTAVLDYLFRAAAEPAVPLGEEPVRYYEFAAADVAAPPGDIDTELVGAGGTLFSAPQLPQAPAGSDGTNVHRVVRIILEDVALTPLGESLTERDRFTVLSDLDRLPVSSRAEWGHLLLDMLRDVPEVPEDHCKWRFRRLLDADGTRQLIVGAATRFDRDVQAAFTAYVQLRHHEVTSRTGRTEESSALGVLLTPRRDRHRPWDTTTVRVHGDLELPPEDLQVYSEAWNRAFDEGAVVDHGRAEQPPAPASA